MQAAGKILQFVSNKILPVHTTFQHLFKHTKYIVDKCIFQNSRQLQIVFYWTIHSMNLWCRLPQTELIRGKHCAKDNNALILLFAWARDIHTMLNKQQHKEFLWCTLCILQALQNFYATLTKVIVVLQFALNIMWARTLLITS